MNENLTPATIKRMEHFGRIAGLFSPSTGVNTDLHDTCLVELVAPATEGKSTIMELAHRLDPDFSLVTGFTTRSEEPRDVPGRYTYFNTELEVNELLDRIEQKTIVQYTQHPTTKQLYGSFPEDYHTKFVMLDVLFNSVDDLDRVAFKSISKIAIVSHGQQWASRFMERYPNITEESTKRVIEAELCLKWMINQAPDDLLWLENPLGGIVQASQELIDIVKHAKPTKALRYMAEEMLDRATKIRRL